MDGIKGVMEDKTDAVGKTKCCASITFPHFFGQIAAAKAKDDPNAGTLNALGNDIPLLSWVCRKG